MTFKEFQEIMKDIYYYATAGAPPKGTEEFTEDEQIWFSEGYTTALRNIRAEADLNRVMPTLPEKKQAAYFKGYYIGIQKVMRELKSRKT